MAGGKCSRWTLPTVLWSVLSLVAAALCALGIYFSNWLERETEDGALNSVSAFRLCLNETSQISTSCNSYFTFSEIYSPEWQAVTLLMGLGACLLVFTALISLFLLCVHGFCNICLMCTNGVLQGLGVFLFLVAIVLFPSGLDNDQVQHPDLCGVSASAYKLGECKVGWAYITIIVGATLGIVAVTMSWTPIMWKKRDNRASYPL